MNNYKITFTDLSITEIIANEVSIDSKTNTIIFYKEISECQSEIVGILNLNQIQSIILN
jgi:hypothetical protein